MPIGQIRTAFLSSTGVDLAAHREAVALAINRLDGWKCIRMEDFGARDEQVDAYCQRATEECHLFIGIIGHRYGNGPKGTKESYTQREYAAARAAGKPRLLFLAPKDFPIPADLIEPAWRITAQAKFRTSLSPERMPAVPFRSAEELATQVTAAIRNWEREQAAPPPAKRPVRKKADGPDPANPHVAAYLNALFEEVRYIDIRGLQVARQQAHRLEIDQLYTPLTTIHSWSALGEKASRGFARGKGRGFASKKKGHGWRGGPEEPDLRGEHKPVPLQQALQQPRLVIVGDPGSGKTTFLHRIAFAVCQTWLSIDAAAANAFLGVPEAPFPMLVRTGALSAFVRDRKGLTANGVIFPSDADSPAWVPLYLATRAHDCGWKLPAKFFEDRLAKGGLLMVDGLDEAPDRVTRKHMAKLLADVARTRPKLRIVVTSRPPAYGGQAVIPEFVSVQVSPLETEAIEIFLRKWCEILYPDPLAAEDHRAQLLKDLRSKPEIRRMAGVPVMLTALAVLHWNEKRLPDQRAELYDSILKWLARSREERLGRLPADQCLNIMKELAWAMHTHPKGRQVDLSPAEAAQAIAGEFRNEPDSKAKLQAAEAFIETEEVDSGILVSRGERVKFWHLTFQEYFAAQVLSVRHPERHRQLIEQQLAFSLDWRETVLLLAAVLYKQGQQQVDEFVACLLNTLPENPSLKDRARCVGLLGAMFEDLRIWSYLPADKRYEAHLHAVGGIFHKAKSARFDFRTRLEAAEALGQAGDPRLRQNNWVRIEAAEFSMGAQSRNPKAANFDAEAFDRESPVRRISISPFFIARYLLTVEEYGQFADSGPCRSRFRVDGDQDSGMMVITDSGFMPISFSAIPEW
jgi:hypothetical protein